MENKEADSMGFYFYIFFFSQENREVCVLVHVLQTLLLLVGVGDRGVGWSGEKCGGREYMEGVWGEGVWRSVGTGRWDEWTVEEGVGRSVE